MSYLDRVSKEIKSPPPDAKCEMKYGNGYNRGYEIGHGQAKCEAKAIANKADSEIAELEAKYADACKVVELGICETEHVVLKINQLYRFVEMPGCRRCKEIADIYRKGGNDE